MNQKKTSKKTSLFEPTFSRVSSVPKENYRIARPSSELPKQQEKDDLKKDDLQTDFKPLEKYYENLNNPLNLNNDLNTSGSQESSQQFGNLSSNISSNISSNLSSNLSSNQQLSTNQNDLNNQTAEQMDRKSNYSSYFGINRLTNYFGYNRDNKDQSNQFNQATEVEPANANLDQSVDNFSAPQTIHKTPQLTPSASTSSFINNAILLKSDPYQLPKAHWFYKVPLNNKQKDSNNDKAYEDQIDESPELNQPFDDSNQDENWLPFAFHDNAALEKAYQDLDANPNVVVPTNGNRYDCYIKDRYRKSVYWEDENQPIRRCTW